MPKLLVINSSNYVEGSINTFSYTLPQSVRFTNKSKVGVASLSLYNSTFNITSARGNNTITFIWNVAVPTTEIFTIPDGYYSVSDLNYFLQQKMIEKTFYMKANNSTNNVYFYEIVQNSVMYGIQLNSYYIPTSAQASSLGYTKPTEATWSFPATYQTPQLTFGTAFGNLIGFDSQTYPSTIQATNKSIVSTKTPNISPVDSYTITCNLINSKYSIPSNVLFSLPLSGSIGTLITHSTGEIIYSDIAPNIYSNIVIQFFDQLFGKLDLKDKEIVLTLAIDDSGETSASSNSSNSYQP